MTVNALMGLFGSLAPVTMTLLLLAGVGLLLKSAFSQDALISEQRESLKQLRDHVVQTVKSQVELNDQVEALRERCARLVAHQQVVKPNSSDHRRFDLAVRMLKRGVGDMTTLHDLGLSDSEAKLLWRLHGSQSVVEAPLLSGSLKTPATATETMDKDIAELSEEGACTLSDDDEPSLSISLEVPSILTQTMDKDIADLSGEGAYCLLDDHMAEGVSVPVTFAAEEHVESDPLMCESAAPLGTSQAQALAEVLRI